MTTITIKIDLRTKAGKALLELVEVLSKDKKGVEIVNEGDDKSSYDPEFVEMVKKAARSKIRTRIDPKNVWESI